MKQNFEANTGSEHVPPPSVKIIEKVSRDVTLERSLEQISDDHIRDPKQMTRNENNEEMKQAYENIVNNRKLERLVVKGLFAKKHDREVTFLSELMNRLTEICISLPDDQIERIISQFKAGLHSRFREYAEELGMTDEDEISEMMSFGLGTGPQAALEPRGIMSAAHFMRARKKIHSVGENMAPAFYFDNYLDAKHKIDLIEVINEGNGLVLNLIQIKSKELAQEDIDGVTQSHRRWINGPVLDMAAYERTFSIEPINSAEFEKTISDINTIETVYTELLSGKDSLRIEVFFDRLGISTVSDPEKIWLLKHHLPQLRQRIQFFQDDNVFKEDHATKLRQMLDGIEYQIGIVEDQKKDLQGIVEVHSLCAVGDVVVSDTVVFSAKDRSQKAARFIN